MRIADARPVGGLQKAQRRSVALVLAKMIQRWHKRISSAVKSRAYELLASGLSMPLLIHDTPTARGFIAAGVAAEDAWDYCVIGCNELGIPGRSSESATSRHGTIQHLALLNQALFEHPAPDSIGGMDELLGCLESEMRKRLRQARQHGIQMRERTAREMPTPFTSSLMRGCVERGRDLLTGMDYHRPGLYERQIANGANALAAIEQLVFDQKALRLSELIDALKADFQGTNLRERIARAPKWAAGDERADRWALRLIEMRERVLDDLDAEFGQGPHMVCHVVRSLHYVDGRRIAASPDGRLAGTPVADSIGAQQNTARAGPTGALNSVLKIDAARYYRGGYNLNITLAKSDASAESVRSLAETFFFGGGQELQINCLDARTLREAREQPERYGNLLVRVAGFSARFVDLAPEEQEELIARADQAEG